jgi:hypothetical protein
MIVSPSTVVSATVSAFSFCEVSVAIAVWSALVPHPITLETVSARSASKANFWCLFFIQVCPSFYMFYKNNTSLLN